MNYYYTPRAVSIKNDFDIDKINENLDKFSNKLEDGCLTTTFDNRVICKVDVSKRYFNFDFTNFSKKILNEIQKYFNPEKYSLKAASGVQEIRLVGDEIYIDNEKYQKMFSIINSTDRTRALSMNVGLVKLTNYGTVKSCIILTSFSNKHYKSSLPEKIKSFSDNLINFDMDIDFHIKTIEDLKNKEVSLVNLSKEMAFNKDGKLIKSVDLKLRAMFNNLRWEHDFKNEKRLWNLSMSNIDDVQGVNVNAKILFDSYIDTFKDMDSSIIARESRRIIDALDKL